MEIKGIMQKILNYYRANPRVGHTKAMLEGVKNVDGVIILAANEHHANMLKKDCPNARVGSYQFIGEGFSTGLTDPMILDNGTICSIFSEVITEIDILEKLVENYRKEPNEQKT